MSHQYEHVAFWKQQKQELQQLLEAGKHTEAFHLARTNNDLPLELSVRACPYLSRHILAYCIAGDIAEAKRIIDIAFTYGYIWTIELEGGKEHYNTIDPVLFTPLHQNDELQTYIKEKVAGQAPRVAFAPKVLPAAIATIPFVNFTEVSYPKKNGTCFLSGEQLVKGDLVYSCGLFSGSYPEIETLFIKPEAFKAFPGAMENLQKYHTKSYSIKDFYVEVDYNNPYLNEFWNTLDPFTLERAQQFIRTHKQVYPAPYYVIDYTFDTLPYVPGRNRIHPAAGMEFPADPEDYSAGSILKTYRLYDELVGMNSGGELLDLLYILIQCGYLEEIVKSLDKLPEWFVGLLAFFEDETVVAALQKYTNLKELPEILASARKNIFKRTVEEQVALIIFAERNPTFTTALATACQICEAHLPGSHGHTWAFASFQWMTYGNGLGIVDFFIPDPTKLPVLATLFQEKTSLAASADGKHSDAYYLTEGYWHRILLLHTLLYTPEQPAWLSLPNNRFVPAEVFNTEIKKHYTHTEKIQKKLLAEYQKQILTPLKGNKL